MDKNLENIVNRVANKNSVAPAKAKLALETFFRNAKHLMQRDDVPTILMHGLGRLTPDENKVRDRLINLKRSLLRKTITQEAFEKEKERFMEVLKVIRDNKHYRNDTKNNQNN